MHDFSPAPSPRHLCPDTSSKEVLHVLNTITLLTLITSALIEPLEPISGGKNVVDNKKHYISYMRVYDWPVQTIPYLIPWQIIILENDFWRGK